jgi:hypothetical protein
LYSARNSFVVESKATLSDAISEKLGLPRLAKNSPLVENGALSDAWATTAPRVGTGERLGPWFALVPSQRYSVGLVVNLKVRTSVVTGPSNRVRTSPRSAGRR